MRRENINYFLKMKNKVLIKRLKYRGVLYSIYLNSNNLYDFDVQSKGVVTNKRYKVLSEKYFTTSKKAEYFAKLLIAEFVVPLKKEGYKKYRDL